MNMSSPGEVKRSVSLNSVSSKLNLLFSTRRMPKRRTEITTTRTPIYSCSCYLLTAGILTGLIGLPLTAVGDTARPVYAVPLVDYVPPTAQAVIDKFEGGFSLFSGGFSESYFAKFLPSRRRRSTTPIPRNRCALKLVADYEFFHLIGIDNYANAARYLVNMIERINGIFTQVDWGVDINGYRLVNLGFSIKEIKIYDRPTSKSPVHFNSDVSARSDGSFSAHDILDSFSREDGTNTTCLTILISGKVFDYGILGLANIGRPSESRGLCATRTFNNTYMNTAVMTVRRKSELMITRVVDLVVAHELGHAWGSLHDAADDPECVPPNSQSGRYVMHESSNTGYDTNNYNFSPCSIHAIHKVLYELAYECFEEEKTSLCGNGILEVGEECDAGWHNVGPASGAAGDTCCTPTCRLRAGAKCSPRHSECCTPMCDFASPVAMCQQRSQEACRREAYCTGDSSKCPEPQPVTDGVGCVDEGKCLVGECVPFCLLHSNDSSPCICKNVTESCMRCCRSMETGLCAPVWPHQFLAEGSICIQGQCHNNVCEKKLTDKAQTLWKHWLRNFQETPSPKFLADNFIFIIVVVSLLVWCPCGALIVYKDHQRHLRIMHTSREEDVYVVPATKRIFRS